MESRCLDPLIDRPFNCAIEDRVVIIVHPENETAVDHYAQTMQPLDGFSVIAVQVLILVLFAQVRGIERLKTDEQTSQSAFDGLLQQVGGEYGFDSARRLPQPTHAFHSVKQRRGEPGVAEKVVVKEVQMAPRQTFDLSQRVIHSLRVERFAAFEKRFLVTEVAGVWASARNHD